MRLLTDGAVRNARAAMWLTVAAILLGLLVFLFGLHTSSNGRFMPAVHGDWANHAAVTSAIFSHEDFNSFSIKQTLNEFASYPKLTYHFGSGIAHAAHLSPLQGLSIVVQLSVILACLFFSLRLTTVAAGLKSTPARLLVFPVLALVLYVGVHVLRIGFRDEVISNSFISQATSLALANAFLFAASKMTKVKWLLVTMALAAWALINTHLAGFTWCGLAMILMALVFPGASAKKRILTAVAGGGIFFVFLVTASGVSAVLALAGTGGDLRAFKGQNLSDYSWLFALLVTLYFFAIAAVMAICKRNKTLYADVVWRGAGFLALGPLMLAAAFTVYSKGGNWYPVMKWIYVYFPEIVLMFVFLATLVSAKGMPLAAVRPHPEFVLPLLAVIFLVQKPYLAANIDLEPAILAGQGVRDPAVLGTHRFPGLRVDHPALNYFIGKTVLKIPMDGPTYAWMGSGATSSTDLGPADFKSVMPVIAPGEFLKYRAGNSIAQRTLNNQWWPLEADHVWASKTPAMLFFIAAQPPTMIHIDFVPFMPNGPGLRKFHLTINGVAMPDLSGTAMDWSKPASYSAPIPPGAVKPDGRIVMALEWAPIVDGDLGVALVAVGYH